MKHMFRATDASPISSLESSANNAPTTNRNTPIMGQYSIMVV